MEALNLDLNKRYSYADYLTWADNVRRELFEGFIKLMTPAPSSTHQIISGNIELIIGNFLKKKQCRMLHAPADVRFPKTKTNIDDKQLYTVLQPDIFVVCDTSKIDIKGCLGAPDLIIEIVSPKNASRDVKHKFKLYEEYGVREYWIVQPNDETVTVFILNELWKYQLVAIYSNEDKIPVNIFNGDLEIDLNEVFE